MFEILKVFVEQIFKVINLETLIKGSDRKKLSEIGAHLFSLYTILNSIYITGRSIVAEIEAGIDRWEHQKKEDPFLFQLNDMLEAQTKNIKDFCLAFVQFSRYIDIIDPQSVRDISIFIETKRNIVNVLTEEMKKQYGTHLFSPTLEDKLLDVASTDKVRALRNSRLAELKGDEEHIRYGFIPHHFRDGDYELYQHDIHRYFLQNLPKPEDEQINYYKMTENK